MDTFRPPLPDEELAHAYKDWLHLNIFDARSGVVGLVNVSLHGAPDDDRSLAVGTALLHSEELGWVGNMEVRPLNSVALGPSSATVGGVTLALSPESWDAHAHVELEHEGLTLRAQARAQSLPVRIEAPLPFGSGWISWSVLSQMTVTGGASVGKHHVNFGQATAYNDHNWGRWLWGDDAGWDWGTFSDAENEIAVVFSRATNRDRSVVTPASVKVIMGARRLSFRGASVRIETRGLYRGSLRRIPGSLAALYSNRARPRLPRSIHIRCADGSNELELEFEVSAVAQLIAAEPTQVGASFIHELAGRFRAQLQTTTESKSLLGLGVFEYVD